MAKTDRSDSESPGTPQRGVAAPTVLRHDFGYRVTIPGNWEVEYTPKVTIQGGQVIYLTPRGNVFFVTFGDLGEVTNKFKTLDDYSRTSIRRLPTQGEVAGKLELSSELTICGHRAILSNLQGNNRAGGFVDVWVVDLWCDVSKRYYSLYGEPTERSEFPYFTRVFTAIAESLACHGQEANSPRPGWQWADLGFSPRAKLWFLQLFDYSGLIEMFQGREIVVKNGTGVQYEWPQLGPKPMWHVRERVFSSDVSAIMYDERGVIVVDQMSKARENETLPDAYDSITYAYSLSTSRGFVEFRDKDDKVLKRIDDKWIAVENLTHKAVGAYPNIRLSAKREDIGGIVITKTTVVIQGKKAF